MNTHHLEAFQLLEKASNILHCRIASQLLQWELSVVQFQTLELIVSRKTVTPSHCSHALNISTSGVTRILDQLERRSLLRREKVGHDRRLVYLRLTQSGLKMFQQASQKLNDGCKDIATRSPLAELAALNDALRKLSQAMQAPTLKTAPQQVPEPRPLKALRAG